MTSAWSLYDDLVALVPRGIAVTTCVVSRWALVETDSGGAGIASVPDVGRPDREGPQDVVGSDLADVAALVRSWDPRLAAIGLAAINAWCNTQQRLEQHAGDVIDWDASAFERSVDLVAGRRVAVVGRFRHLDQLAGRCDLAVLERHPQGDDLPDAAAEFVLPEVDHAFVTSMTLANKTAPRLLELAAQARTTLVGPSTPLAPEAFAGRVDELSGSVVYDAPWCRRALMQGQGMASMRGALTLFNLRVPA
ncbi:Rossmann-like domain-containing protein [Arsenicicoccus sp. oral taxon 190]|uniref:Rossmann-like domain-containing protein n=1 Tax=Arsenicicoccus sp. oral taxon 190 TaxID=1658671 RepID=UPI00067D8C34|nr:DUF364 domain-containing protein [Arsenicicoccus sp. oral taxon 190]